MRELINVAGEILKWLGRNPWATRAIVVGVREVDRWATRQLFDYRAAVAAKGAAERQRKIDEIRGRVAAATVPECLDLLELLRKEDDNEVKKAIIDMIAHRLLALNGGSK